MSPTAPLPQPRPNRLAELRARRSAVGARRAYHCRCGRPIFFRNSLCLGCQTPLGYEPQLAEVVPLEPAEPAGLWRVVGEHAASAPAGLYRRCGNFESPAGCNWLLPADGPGAEPAQTLCIACRLNRTIPDLSVPENGPLWASIELAKRRLVSSLLALGLPVRSRLSEDPDRGLAFDFLKALPGAPVTTGHAAGIITLNLDEADDAKRERMRLQMHEPYRTLLGHLRHEVGHYYWDRLVAGTPWHEPFRSLFGDEREDYQAALDRHYRQGAAGDWPLRHVSAYASMHPWEDWAETWAHYLHMVDTLDTSLSLGLTSDLLEIEWEPFGPEALYRSEEPGAVEFLSFVNGWIELTGVLNELTRSMGERDFYPFVLSAVAVRKLHFVHLVVAQAPQRAAR
ncbi:putative zinc-binding peptidase [Aquabacterium sp. A7-Y]|uniref:zinc-binding metallopeptidase family protein n=1 Tax=Aquabacterium sp. A7-Y TaxID=1349605 RepID=UPI00223D7E42|nr:putative zinc-binding peptidase [Aquabacterium sp. A7-Y]MCW7538831.1 putative zinc-binding peptidase [Aquabacterium sp. A7-Y]